MRVMSAGSRKRIEREVGATRAEFLRALALAHSPGVEALGPDTYRVRSGDVVLDISLFEAPPRRTFVVHGEAGASAALREAMSQRLGWTAIDIPQRGERYRLD